MSQDFPKTFQVKKEEIKLLYIISFLLFFILIYGYFFDVKILKLSIILISLIAPIIALKLWRFPHLLLSIDELGIWRTKVGREKTFTAWDTIVDYRRSTWQGNLVLIDKNNHKRITVHSELNKIKELINLILVNSEIKKNIDTSQKEFVKPYHHLFYAVATLLICLLFPIIPFINRYNGNTCANSCDNTVFIALSIFMILVFLWLTILGYCKTIYRLTINGDHIKLFYGLRRKSISNSDIEHIELKNHHGVIIKIKGQKKLIHLGSLSDAIKLFYCLRNFTNDKLL